tara:strand:- start:5494 stop:6573 length:1080 start_codon:yes stop_codon:yes gene_type:complete
MISTAQYAALLNRIDDLEGDNRFLPYVGSLRKEIDDMNKDFYTEVAKGNVPGHRVIHKFGVNGQIDIASGFEAIWNGGGTYTGHNATAAQAIEVFSSNAADVGTLLSSGTTTGGSATTITDSGATFVSDGVAAGDLVINDTQKDHAVIVSLTETELTFFSMDDKSISATSDAYRVVSDGSTGCSVIRIANALDGNWAEAYEYVILNGVTGVDTVGTYLRCSTVKCIGALNNVGAITARQKTTTANIFAVLPAGYNSTMMAAFTVPAGETGFFIHWFAAMDKKTAATSVVRLRAGQYGQSFQVKEESAVGANSSGGLDRIYRAPKNSLTERTDIFIEADTDANNTGISAGFDILLIQDGY